MINQLPNPLVKINLSFCSLSSSHSRFPCYTIHNETRRFPVDCNQQKLLYCSLSNYMTQDLNSVFPKTRLVVSERCSLLGFRLSYSFRAFRITVLEQDLVGLDLWNWTVSIFKVKQDYSEQYLNPPFWGCLLAFRKCQLPLFSVAVVSPKTKLFYSRKFQCLGQLIAKAILFSLLFNANFFVTDFPNATNRRAPRSFKDAIC